MKNITKNSSRITILNPLHKEKQGGIKNYRSRNNQGKLTSNKTAQDYFSK